MKNLSKILFISLLAVVTFAACEKKSDKNIFSEYDIVDDSNVALIKVNYNVAFRSNPLVQLKINGTRVSGTNIQTRYPFPGGGFNTLGGSTGDYLPVAPGGTQVLISIPKRGTGIDSIEIFKTTLSTVAGKRYTLHVADTVATKSLLVDEDATLPDLGNVRFRFVNLMPNIPFLDLYIGSQKVASNIAFMGISDKFTLPTSQSDISTVWTIRTAGALPTSTAIATYTSANTLLNQRVYTAFATGYSGFSTALTTEPRRPFLAFYYVR